MPTLIVTPASVGGTTRRRYRQLLAEKLGSRLETTVSAVAVAGDATRVILADELQDDEDGWGWDDQIWAYVLDGDQADTQRRVMSQPEVGYRGADAMLMLSRGFDDALAVGDTVEITSPLPAKSIGHVDGLNKILNEALACLPAIATLTVTGADSDRLLLTPYPYLTHEDQILGIYDRYSVIAANAARPTGLPFRIDANGTTRYLVFGRQYASTETLEIQVTLPGDRLIYDGAAWGTPTDTPGLLGDAYQASVPEHWVLTFGMVIALRVLERLTVRRRDLDKDLRATMLGEIHERLATWSVAAVRLRLTEFPHGQQRRSPSLISPTTTSTTSNALVAEVVGQLWP